MLRRTVEEAIAMEKRAASVVPYQGPTINGRLALSAKEVQQWFRDAVGVIPTVTDAMSITVDLNHCALFVAQWNDSPAFKLKRKNSPARLQMARICEALTTLQMDLEALIDNTRKIFPTTNADKLEDVTLLLDVVNKLAPTFQKFGPSGPGAKRKAWHNIARNLGPRIRAALRSSGIKRAGFGKPTSPAVTIMKSALAYLGVDASVEAIVDAMRGRVKVGKKTLKMSQTSPS